MTRSRSIVLGSSLVVIVGALAAVGAIYLSPARAAVGPMPAEGLVLPADTRFVVGLDVRRLMASELYTSNAGRRPFRPEAFADLEAKTGLNPERDVDQVVIAGGPSAGTGRHGAGLVLVSGRFDRYKLSRALETARKDVTWKDHQGTTVYLFGEGRKGADAAAFLDDDTIVFGSQAAVQATIGSRAGGKAPLRTNASIMALLERVKPGSTFWMVGDQSLLANLPKSIPAPGADGSGLQLPAVRTLVVTGDLDPQVALDVTAETADEAAAKNLADVVRGLMALATLQGSQKPELKELASAVSVTTETNQVHLSARIPHALFQSLQPKKLAESPGVAR
jgi:uncharacterized membrane protein